MWNLHFHVRNLHFHMWNTHENKTRPIKLHEICFLACELCIFKSHLLFSHMNETKLAFSQRNYCTYFTCLFFLTCGFHSHYIRHYQWLMRQDANELPYMRSCSCLSTWGLALAVLQFNLFMKHPVLKQCYLLRCNIYVYFKMWWNRISVGN